MPLHQPIAVIGIGVCFPFASNFAELKTRLKAPGIERTSTMKWGEISRAPRMGISFLN